MPTFTVVSLLPSPVTANPPDPALLSTIPLVAPSADTLERHPGAADRGVLDIDCRAGGACHICGATDHHRSAAAGETPFPVVELMVLVVVELKLMVPPFVTVTALPDVVSISVFAPEK
ncbi:MAG: hypothetical protein HPM95_10725 [Alphaproteobacteria bacterium]|nr:hypothetical protein [Alphaproteobacteria bacterium]